MSYIYGMDTIIFFYQNRNPVQREISLMYQEDYLLAKVGIYTDGHSWFGCPLPHAPAPPESMPDASLSVMKSRELRMQDGASGETQTAGKHRESWFGRHREIWHRRREMRRQQQEYMQKLQEYEEQKEELTVNMRQLREEVFSEVERAGGMDEVSCVYEDGLRFLADGQGETALCWGRVWNVPEFSDYKGIRWIRPLLEYVRHSDFILLGTADCIPALLAKLARQMRSLQWYLREEDLNEEVQGWVEDFYEEYGLAIALRKLTGGNVFRQLKIKPVGQVCVMDFTDEEKLFAGNLESGSIWIDFASVEAKSRRMEKQAPDVSYMSLKKYWGAKTKMKPVFPEHHAVSRFRFS